MPVSSKAVHLVARPQGEPETTDFAVVETLIADPGPGQVLVRNDWMSVDPYMRGRMDAGESYVAPFELDQPMDGAAVGTVIASACDIPVGTVVSHRLGWREYAALDAARVQPIDTTKAAEREYLGVLGMTGLTATPD